MAAAALWLLLFGALHAMTGLIVPPLFSVAPLIVATVADERRTAIVAGAAAALAVGAVWWHGLLRDGAYWTRVAAACVIGAMAVVVAGIRCRREERLARMTAIAEASQLALLPPLPPEMTGINIAARYRSATRDASVGGDLYEIIPTSHGIRAIIGDVCGNGLDAILLARHVLSAFRRSAVAAAALEHVAGEVSRAIAPHLGEEDFVTRGPGPDRPRRRADHRQLRPPPAAAAPRGDLQPLTGGTAALPLGLDDDFTAFTTSWSHGDRLLLYTDGLVESRDEHGDFLPEDAIATALAAADCDHALDTLMTAVHRHTGGHGHDDMALLLLNMARLRAAAPMDTQPPRLPSRG